MSTHVVLWYEEPQVARMISCRLMRADFEVHSVHDAESASEVLERVKPGLLVTSCNAPPDELLEQAHDNEIPVIGLTSGSRSCHAVDLCRRGLIAAAFSLPCSLRRLVELAQHVTQREPSCLLAAH